MVLRTRTLTRRFVGTEKKRHDEGIGAVLLQGVMLSILDISLMFSAGVATFFTLAGYVFSPVHRGFKCDDDSIRRPFYENTVSPEQLLWVSLLVPYLVIMVCEGVYFAFAANTTGRLRKYFSSSTGVFLEYLAAYAICTILMELMKCAFGRLRPHFVTVCQPDWSRVDCKTDPTSWISDAHCTGGEIPERVARGSFPSGHSAAAAISLLFLHLYLREVTTLLTPHTPHKSHHQSPGGGSPSHGSGGASPLVQGVFNALRMVVLVCFAVWSVWVWATRVTDCWHHPTDVAGGVALGLATIAPFFKGRYRQQAVEFRMNAA